jgi:hypothetical protein
MFLNKLPRVATYEEPPDVGIRGNRITYKRLELTANVGHAERLVHTNIVERFQKVTFLFLLYFKLCVV